ncbi:MAG TPA: hypothetical protein VN706_14220 [Gemmatimonadaceae bacterium]|nr:hypothetical protein [Gemmatimonadaceae bacterium]
MGAIAAFAAVPVAGAQQTDSSRAASLRALDSLITDAAAIAAQVPATAAMLQSALRAQPGNTVGSESAWGAGWGDFFAGVGYQSRTRFTAHPDGSASIGFGIGDPRRLIGLEVGLNSASTLRETPGDNGSVSIKLHRSLPGEYGIAVGVENIANWGSADGGSSTYGVVSHTFVFREDPSHFFGSMAWNVGLGNSRFLSQHTLDQGKTGVNGFGSAGIRLMPRASIVADWTGQDLDAGISVVPLHHSPLVLSLGVADVTRHAGDGPRLIVGLGAGFRVFELFKESGR